MWSELELTSQYGRKPKISRRRPAGVTAASVVTVPVPLAVVAGARTANEAGAAGVAGASPFGWSMPRPGMRGARAGPVCWPRIALPSRRPDGKDFGDAPPTDQRSEDRGEKPTVTRPPG